jgi:diadenylate cyclase
LEKQREMFNDSLLNFNVLEINGLVTINDVCEILQRLEIIKRISDIVKRYLVELGKEGMIVSMRLKELTGGLTRVEEFILKDYFDINYTKSANLLSQMSFDFLLETSNISRILFEELHDKSIFPKGLRILSRANLLERHLYSLIDKFKNLGAILSLENNELLEIFETKENVEVFLRNLNSIKDKIAVGKNI